MWIKLFKLMNFDKFEEEAVVELDKVKAATGTAGKYFKAVPGTHTLRLVDCYNDIPFMKFHTNYNLAERPFVVENEEYLTKHGWDYWSKDDADDSPRRKFFKKIMPNTRYSTQVIDVNDPDGGVKIWSMSKTTYDKLLVKCRNVVKEGIDPTSHMDGLDLIVTVTKTGAFPVTELDFSRKQSTLPDGVVVDESDLHDIESLVTYKTKEEVDQIVKQAAAKAF